MKFTEIEIIALLKVGVEMQWADGISTDQESNLIAMQCVHFGIIKEKLMDLIDSASVMRESDCMIILSGMSLEKKKFASGFLAAIMVSDGDMAGSELILWNDITEKCGFPKMQLTEALNYWVNN